MIDGDLTARQAAPSKVPRFREFPKPGTSGQLFDPSSVLNEAQRLTA
jgi:hypothetical protein